MGRMPSWGPGLIGISNQNGAEADTLISRFVRDEQ